MAMGGVYFCFSYGNAITLSLRTVLWELLPIGLTLPFILLQLQLFFFWNLNFFQKNTRIAPAQVYAYSFLSL